MYQLSERPARGVRRPLPGITDGQQTHRAQPRRCLQDVGDAPVVERADPTGSEPKVRGRKLRVTSGDGRILDAEESLSPCAVTICTALGIGKERQHNGRLLQECLPMCRPGQGRPRCPKPRDNNLVRLKIARRRRRVRCCEYLFKLYVLDGGRAILADRLSCGNDFEEVHVGPQTTFYRSMAVMRLSCTARCEVCDMAFVLSSPAFGNGEEIPS